MPEAAPPGIIFCRGDLLAADTQALVNAVNCVGVMGRGIALQFKTAYPANFQAYAAACRRGEVVPGRMFIDVRVGYVRHCLPYSPPLRGVDTHEGHSTLASPAQSAVVLGQGSDA